MGLVVLATNPFFLSKRIPLPFLTRLFEHFEKRENLFCQIKKGAAAAAPFVVSSIGFAPCLGRYIYSSSAPLAPSGLWHEAFAC